MSTVPFQLDPQLPPPKMLASLPAGLKVAALQGFSLLNELSEEKATRLVEFVREAVIAQGPVDQEKTASEFGLGRTQMGALVAAASLMAVAMSPPRQISAQTFVDAAIEANVLDRKDSDAALRLGKLVEAQRPAMRRALDRARMLAEVLPVLTNVDWTVDLRFGFAKDKIDAAIPIAMVFLDTDRQGQEICFQITKPHLERLIQELGRALSRIRLVEEWAARHNSA